MLKHGIKFVILARTSCVRVYYSPQMQTHRVVQPSCGMSQRAAIKAKSEIYISDCSIYRSDQKYLTHKCLDKRYAFLHD